MQIESAVDAILAGRTGGGAPDGIAAHEQMINGAPLSLSVLLLMFGLRVVLGSYGKNRHIFDSAMSLVLVATSVLGPAIALALRFSSALGVERYRAGVGEAEPCDVGGMTAGVWINLDVSVAAVAVVVVLALVRDRLPRWEAAPELIAKTVLGFTILLAVSSAIAMPLLPAGVVASTLIEHAALVLTAVLTVAFAAASWVGR